MSGIRRIRKLGMEYTDELIERIVDLASDPRNWRPSQPGDRELGREIADADADTYTDDDWRYLLNRLDPLRAAQTINDRSPEQRPHLLGLIDPHRRARIEQMLTVIA